MVSRERIFRIARGFRGRAKNCIRIASTQAQRAMQYQYRDRKNRKRDFRRMWIQQISAGVKEHGASYSTFMHGLSKQNINLNRKVLSDLAMNEPLSFKALVDQVKFMRGAKGAKGQSAIVESSS